MVNEDDFLRSEFTAPWETRRGISTIFSNHTHIYFNCNIQDLQTIFTNKTETIITDALDQSILIDGHFAIAFQLEEHTWSTLIPSRDCYDLLNSEFIKKISNANNLKVITLGVSDTSGSVEYRIFDNGNIVEFFSGREEEFDMPTNEPLATKHQLFIDEDDPEYFQTAYFYTKSNNVNIPINSSIYTFPSKRFEDYDLYAPQITVEYFFGNQDILVGAVYQLQSNGFSMSLHSGETIITRPNFRRVDFYAFYS